ncbi:MAG: alpha amylase family protein, partial [Bacteroidales bacterium]
YNVSVDFPQWATLNYKKTGYAATLDYQIPTLNVKTLNGSDWTSVEGGLLNAKNITRGVVPIVGGLVGENYQSNPDDIRKAVVLCMTKAQGVIFQDLSELVRYNLWGKVNQGISEALGTKPVSKDVVIEKITRTINGKLIAGYSAIIDFRQNTNLKFNVLLPNVVTKPSVTMKTLPQEKGTPILAVNAGFFWLNASNSLVIIGGEHKAPNTPSMIRNGKTVYPVRSAIGLMPNGKFEITWVYNVSGNKTYSYPSALDNNEQTNTYMPAPPTAATAGAKEWNPIEAVGGG